MKKYSDSEIVNEFLNKASEKEAYLQDISSSPKIQKILESFGKNPEELEDMYWKLMACGVDDRVAKKIIKKPKLLKKYLQMKSDGISDLEVAHRFIK